MGRNEALLTHEDAAKTLGVTERHLRHLVRQGAITPAKLGKRLRDSLYLTTEVHALLELRIRRVDMPTVANTAMQAHALARSISDKLDKVCRFLGLENNRLRYDEESVYRLHVKVRDTLNEDLTALRSPAIIEWASVFNSFDEAYLRIIEQYTLNPNPWDIYLQLANALMQMRSEETDSNLTFAYACLDAARRNLRHVAYFYVATRNGMKAANDAFKHADVTEEIIAQLFPRTIGPQ